MLQIQIINGPNLNLLGKREPEVYGDTSFEVYFSQLRKQFPDFALHYFQSNHEGDIIDKLHEVGFVYDGVVINPGAYSHYSYAIADAIKAISTPVVEVHISDIQSREEFRKISVTGVDCIQMVSGKGLGGYQEAIEILTKK
ncbi:MAG: type II 3-dehydroquinate dehydratase [Moheibacter sp.]